MLVNELVGRWNMLVSFLRFNLVFDLGFDLKFWTGFFGLGFGQGNLVRQF